MSSVTHQALLMVNTDASGFGWDPATKTSVTLSGNNLVATNTGTTSADQGAHVPAASGKSSGKYYFEVTHTTNVGGGNRGIGIGTTASTYTNIGNSATTGDIVYLALGTIWANGGSSGRSIALTGAGNVIGVAVDLDNKKIWFRLAPAGNWNGQVIGSQNPEGAVGGVVVPAGTMVPFVVFGGLGGLAGNALTGNFGATAFTGAVPVGFTSGWPQ